MTHVLVRDDYIVFCCHIVCQVVIHDQSEQSVQQCRVNLLIHFVHLRLNQHGRLVLGTLPNVCQIIETLTPLVNEQGRRLLVGRLHPIGEQVSLVSLVPQVLVQVGVSDLLQRLYVIDWNDVRV